MQQLLKRLKEILSANLSGKLCLLIAIIAKIAVQIEAFGFGGDKSYQLVAAKNLLAGNGITIGQVSLSDLSTISYQPLVGWPPGYTIAVAPLLWLFNGDYQLAALSFDLLCLIPFFYFLLRLSDFLITEKWLRNLFILFTGLFIYPATSKLGTDLFSFSCMMGAFYYLLQLMEKPGRRYVFLTALTLFLAGLFRYNYIPVAMAIPVLLLIAAFVNKKKEWKISAFYLGAILIGLFSLLLLFQYYYTGAATYIRKTETGFYGDHLLDVHPIVLSSLADIETWLGFFSRATGTDYISNRTIISDISFILFLLLLLYSMAWLVRKKLKLADRSDNFISAGTGISLSIIAVLAYLAASNAMLHWASGEEWTYLLEHRYFVFVCFFIQLIVFARLFAKYKILNRFWKGIAISCAFLMILNSVHKGLYIAKLSVSESKKIIAGDPVGNDADLIMSMYKKIKRSYPDHEIIVASPKKVICNYAALENIKSSNELRPFHMKNLVSSKPTKILLVLEGTYSKSFLPALAQPGVEYLQQQGEWYFYLLNVAQAN
ncbi:MAG TPA: hypothetical protein VF476_12310 [Chitinophagaceae bacterium]